MPEYSNGNLLIKKLHIQLQFSLKTANVLKKYIKLFIFFQLLLVYMRNSQQTDLKLSAPTIMITIFNVIHNLEHPLMRIQI